MLYSPYMESFTHRIHLWLKRHSYVRTAIIFVLVLLCAFELDAILRGLQTAYTGTDPYLSYHHGQVVRENDIVKPSDIQPWMTFQYIDFIFKLPPNYLQDSLVITDPRYPNVQIARYARMHGLVLQTFLKKVQTTVAGYTPETF